MPGYYVCDCAQINPLTYGPVVPTANYETLMVDRNQSKALISSPDLLTGRGIIRLATAPTWGELVERVSTTAPTGLQRAAVVAWCKRNRYRPPTRHERYWSNVLLFIARQINPVARLAPLKGP